MKIFKRSKATGDKMTGQAGLLLFKSRRERQPLFLSDLETWLPDPSKAATALVEPTLQDLSWQNHWLLFSRKGAWVISL